MSEIQMTLTAIVIADWNENGVELIFDNDEKCVAHLFFNKSDVVIKGTNTVGIVKYSCREFTEGEEYISFFNEGELYDIKKPIQIISVS